MYGIGAGEGCDGAALNFGTWASSTSHLTAIIPSLPAHGPRRNCFLTFRLHSTIPAAIGRELKAALRQAQEAGTGHRRAQKKFFARFDAELDRAPTGAGYFEHEKLAEVLASETMMLEETGFTVHGFAILPNHVHLVLHLLARSNLSFAKTIDLLHLRTGTNCRRMVRPKLPPKAEFWQTGWFSYEVEDDAELTRLLAYVHGNARAAGLPARFQKWPFTSIGEA